MTIEEKRVCAEREGYDRRLGTCGFLGPQPSDFPLGEDMFGLIRRPPPPLRPAPDIQDPDKPPALADRSRRRTFRSWRGPGERGGGGGVRVGKRSSASPSGHLACPHCFSFFGKPFGWQSLLFPPSLQSLAHVPPPPLPPSLHSIAPNLPSLLSTP